MKKFTVRANKYLQQDVQGYYHDEYIGYQQSGNPDYINHLKNMTKQHTEIALVKDFVEVAERFTKDLRNIIKTEKLHNAVVCCVPRSKKESYYAANQLLFKKAISSVADSENVINGTNAIKRIRDTKTTHSWRMENNTGDSPYVGITHDTCEICKKLINNQNIVLVDDIYTEGVFVAEDCIQTLLNLGAKSVILYVLAKTRG